MSVVVFTNQMACVRSDGMRSLKARRKRVARSHGRKSRSLNNSRAESRESINCTPSKFNATNGNEEENALIKSEATTAGNRLDRLGAAASLTCAAHCAAMPLLIGLLPLVGLSFLAKEQTEWALVGLSFVIGSLSLIPSYARKHRQLRPLMLFAFGSSLIIAVRLLAEEGSHLEAPAMTLGALLIAFAHMVNRRLCRCCAACHPNDKL
jgi:MerC mercury resistance protein